jgi:hypothetical protein
VSSEAPYWIGLQLFVRGSDNALWWKSYDQIEGWWGPWTSLGGGLTSSPAAISRYVAAIEVFARGNDGALWSRYSTDNGVSWSNWASLGGKLLDGTGPAVSAREGGFDVFVIGTDHALWQKTWTSSGGTVDWKSLGGYLTSSPAASSFAPDWIQVFGRGGDGALWSRSTSNGRTWSNWGSLGGKLLAGTGPAACSLDAHTQDVFVIGTDGAVWWKRYTDSSGGYSAWTFVGGKTPSSPSATPMSGGISLWVLGGDAYPWSNGYYKHPQWTWSSWKRLQSST